MKANLSAWDKKVVDRTGWCHFLQSAVWSRVKGATAWKPQQVELPNGYPLVLFSRSTPGLGRVHYAPKLAKLETADAAAFTDGLRQGVGKGIALRIELDQLHSESLDKALLEQGWQHADEIQYQATVLVDLSQFQEELFNSFKKRVRWEIRAAARRGVVAEQIPATTENLRALFNMLEVTSHRGNFRTRGREFSENYWKLFAEAGQGFVYQARVGDEVASMAYVIQIGDRAYYKDGASTREHANLFASRLMHWQIMQDLQKNGCKTYDLCGVMRAHHIDDKNRGLYTFKTGFADPVELQGSYILPLSGLRHKAWQKLEPIVGKAYLRLRNDLWY